MAPVSKFPQIVATPPNPKAKALIKKIERFEMPMSGVLTHAFGEWPLIFDGGEGALLKDMDGNTYIDLNGGFGSASTGYGHPDVIAAIKHQLDSYSFCGGRLVHPLRAELAEKIVSLSPGGLDQKVLIGNTGSEAVEHAIKIAHYSSGRSQLIAFQGSFHGRFHGSLTLSSGRFVRGGFHTIGGVIHAPFAYCYRCPIGRTYPDCGVACADYIDHLLTDPASGANDVAALIVEPLQGFEGFAIVPPPRYLPKLKAICQKHGLEFIADEIYSGFARTGKWFACEHDGVTPDIMTCGKGGASGLPLAVVVARNSIVEKCADTKMSATFQANPVSCAAALATIQVIEKERLVEKASKHGEYLMRSLEDIYRDRKISGEVRGRGLFIGAEIVTDEKSKTPDIELARAISRECIKRGVFVEPGGRYGNCLRITPPLVIAPEQVDKTVEIIDQAARSAMG